MLVNSVKMANMYDLSATCSSSSLPSETNDDIYMFLRQVLLKSSSPSFSPSFIATNEQMQCEIPRLQPVYSSGLSAPDRTPTLSSANDAYIPANAMGYVSSSSVGTIDNRPNEYDCESEEGFENLTEEMAAKSNPTRNPSKRSRAADVHNMSEKRRRSRINEKMKALQKLIPNSNKTDKASMLDEVIEYLKQLQLRVQMLTMKNGMMLNSMSVLHEVHQPPLNPMLNLQFESSNGGQSSIAGFSNIINLGTSLNTHMDHLIRTR